MTAYALRVRADESLLYRARFEHTALYSHIYIYICIYLASRRDELPAPRSPNSMSEEFNSRLSCSWREYPTGPSSSSRKLEDGSRNRGCSTWSRTNKCQLPINRPSYFILSPSSEGGGRRGGIFERLSSKERRVSKRVRIEFFQTKRLSPLHFSLDTPL